MIFFFGQRIAADAHQSPPEAVAGDEQEVHERHDNDQLANPRNGARCSHHDVVPDVESGSIGRRPGGGRRRGRRSIRRCRSRMRGFLDFACSPLHLFDRPRWPERTEPQSRAELLGGARHDVQDLNRLRLKRLEAETEANENHGKRQPRPHGFRQPGSLFQPIDDRGQRVTRQHGDGDGNENRPGEIKKSYHGDKGQHGKRRAAHVDRRLEHRRRKARDGGSTGG